VSDAVEWLEANSPQPTLFVRRALFNIKDDHPMIDGLACPVCRGVGNSGDAYVCYFGAEPPKIQAYAWFGSMETALMREVESD
jgi:hypothetical protein